MKLQKFSCMYALMRPSKSSEKTHFFGQKSPSDSPKKPSHKFDGIILNIYTLLLVYIQALLAS